MNNVNHPVWALARLIVLMLTLVVILYLNSNQFDSDEFEVVKWFLLAASGTVGMEYFLKKILNGRKNNG